MTNGEGKALGERIDERIRSRTEGEMAKLAGKYVDIESGKRTG